MLDENKRRAIIGFGLFGLIGLAGAAVFVAGAMDKLGYIGNRDVQREQYISIEQRGYSEDNR